MEVSESNFCLQLHFEWYASGPLVQNDSLARTGQVTGLWENLGGLARGFVSCSLMEDDRRITLLAGDNNRSFRAPQSCLPSTSPVMLSNSSNVILAVFLRENASRSPGILTTSMRPWSALESTWSPGLSPASSR